MNIKSMPSGSKLLAARDAWNAVRKNPKATEAQKATVKAAYRRLGSAVARELGFHGR